MTKGLFRVVRCSATYAWTIWSRKISKRWRSWPANPRFCITFGKCPRRPLEPLKRCGFERETGCTWEPWHDNRMTVRRTPVSSHVLGDLTWYAQALTGCWGNWYSALQREGVTIPSTLLGKLNTFSALAGAVASFPAALKLTDAGARDLIILLGDVLEWATVGAIAKLDVSAAATTSRSTGFVV